MGNVVIWVNRMYAIIEDSGRQYRVEEGQELEVDFRDVNPGDQLTFDRVLAVSDGVSLRAGKPIVAGAAVSATVLVLVWVTRSTFRSSVAARTHAAAPVIAPFSLACALRRSAPRHR